MSGYPVVDGVTVLVLPPPGITPDFDHPRQNKWLEHYLVFGIGAPLAFLALCQRFYTKIFLSRGLQLDDCEHCHHRSQQQPFTDPYSVYVPRMGT
jgi:hypothetical protein